ncbi:MFS transporter [Microbacterium sp. Se5.02b]|uniref:MFS transporter n=1 Tax=Microbacterium sp. Se5.02b TaxID=2864103 RepID=UPI001C68C0F4|nr:MFS transporter [Microbacterium sp. Se5.02b]QYM65069.1 MFS transporter [Microbacterium sp. Se5.02b]
MSDLTTRATAQPLTVEEAIDRMPRVGLSRGAWLALMLAFFFANYDIGVFAVSIPSMISGIGLNPADLSWPVAANLAGYAVGAYIFGHISDRRGRQLGLFLTIALLGVGGALTAVSWDAASLSFFRFLTGGGMGAVLALCSAYIGEMAPKNRRGKYLSLLYVIGGILNLIVGFASLPVLAALPSEGWRILMGFGGLVLLILPFINRRDLMESPRWLAEQGRIDEATEVVRSMQRTVGVEVARGTLAAPAHHLPDVEAERPLRTLLRPPLLWRLLTVLGFWFIFYIAMYGFSSYLPLILEGVGVSTSNALLVTVLTRGAPLIVGFIVVALIEKWERRTMIIIGTLVFALGIVLIILGWGDAWATAGSLLATAGIAFMATPAYTYTAEVFPTAARGTAASICDGLGHLGGAVAPFIILPILLGAGAVPAGATMIALLIVSALLIRMGVRTKDRSLAEISS